MFNEIIFVDFENFTKIIDDIKKKDAKIVVLAGLKQADKPFAYAKELLDSVSSVELLKVKGEGKDALDFFIAYYLGVYTSRNKELKFTICSNDKGYDPLIKHLCDNKIIIKRLEFRNEPKVKTIPKPKVKIVPKPKVIIMPKPKEQPNSFETDKDYKKAFDNIKGISAKKRPRKLKGFESYVKNIFHETIQIEKINEIIDGFKKHKYIEVENENIKYNM